MAWLGMPKGLRRISSSPIKAGIGIPPPLLKPGRAEVELLRGVGGGVKKPAAIDPSLEALQIWHARRNLKHNETQEKGSSPSH